jgi:hypothetical protein
MKNKLPQISVDIDIEVDCPHCTITCHKCGKEFKAEVR